MLHAFQPLRRDIRCDVAVLGAGITGALIAAELATHGHDVVVIEQRDVGWGSTAASTALLQYEIDTQMVDLASQYGEAEAVLAYRACASAIPMLQELATEVRDVGFARNHSLYYASKRGHVRTLREEFVLRARHGLPVHWLDRNAVNDRYGIDAPCAILSTMAARVDPYRFAYRLLMRLERSGIGVFDHAPVRRIEAGQRGVTLQAGEDTIVRCKHLVVATGYAGQQLLDQRVARNRSTYAFATDPIDADALGALKDTMLWESTRPYLYMRSTADGRLLVGGEDDAIDIPDRRDARVGKKARRLCQRAANMFPHLSLKPAFAWAGTFAETRDGLPFFGAHLQYGPRVHFAMAFGGNGITYAMLGAGLLRALIERRRHPLANLFSFKRLDR
ncbi:MAG: FAD-binding oxidoreductase [Gammaproteobacteria bacterium]|nr:FAD-binding oxidoreductase [Gammaproteobacteria bacterium]